MQAALEKEGLGTRGAAPGCRISGETFLSTFLLCISLACGLYSLSIDRGPRRRRSEDVFLYTFFQRWGKDLEDWPSTMKMRVSFLKDKHHTFKWDELL